MNCADAVARLSPALDGELAEADAADVRRHLGTCEACARRYRTLQQVRAAVRGTPFAAVDAARFDTRVYERVRHDGRAARISGPLLAAAAALVIGVSSAVLMLQEHTAGPPRDIGEAAVAPPDAGAIPGLTDGPAALAMDCGVSGATSCVIEAPPGLMAGN